VKRVDGRTEIAELAGLGELYVFWTVVRQEVADVLVSEVASHLVWCRVASQSWDVIRSRLRESSLGKYLSAAVDNLASVRRYFESDAPFVHRRQHGRYGNCFLCSSSTQRTFLVAHHVAISRSGLARILGLSA
jgi:hypothetical protein